MLHLRIISYLRHFRFLIFWTHYCWQGVDSRFHHRASNWFNWTRRWFDCWHYSRHRNEHVSILVFPGINFKSSWKLEQNTETQRLTILWWQSQSQPLDH